MLYAVFMFLLVGSISCGNQFGELLTGEGLSE